MAKFLTTLLKTNGFNKVEVFQDKTKVRGNGNFSVPSVLKEFKTTEEAKAYIEGIIWIANYYGIDVSHYTKEF